MANKIYIHFPFNLFPQINQKLTVTVRQVPVLPIKRPDAIRRITVKQTTK